MIHQRFYPISTLLNPIQGQCQIQAESYFKEEYKLDSKILTEKIISSEKLLFSILENLSMLKRDEDVVQHVQRLNPECCFLLYVSIQIAFLHFHADTELLPLLPLEKIYYFLFAYLQEAYLSFKRHCQQNGQDIWELILEYECDLYKRLTE